MYRVMIETSRLYFCFQKQHVMKIIDNLLNRITMYRLVFYELIFLVLAGGVMSLVGHVGALPFSPMYLLFSVIFIVCACLAVNKTFAFLFEVPANPESTWITALILALIITPPSGWLDTSYLSLAFWASAVAIASKYILAIQRKHVFNPVAFGLAVTSLALGLSASWWIGTPIMAPFVLVGGLLVVRKISRFDLFGLFVGTFTVGIASVALAHGENLASALSHAFWYTPVFFFAATMLTEPLTTPPSRRFRIFYAAFVGFLFLPAVHIGSLYFTPELALLVGNVFSYLISPKYKLILKLTGTERLSSDIYEFTFATDSRISYKPGQYMEWTLAHKRYDTRSVRRYFTLASSPTEREIKLGVKFYKQSSTFKRALLSMRTGESIVASQLGGDFILPKNKKKKLVFIAGGIGVTPFRSMIQYLLDEKERRPITLLYSSRTPADAVYKDLFDRAERELGIKTAYSFTGKNIPLPAESARALDAHMIAREVPDYTDRTFYISGPQRMVTSFKEILLRMGIARTHIKTDYFTGFA